MDSSYMHNMVELQALLNRQSADLDDAIKKANTAVRIDGTNLSGGKFFDPLSNSLKLKFDASCDPYLVAML